MRKIFSLLIIFFISFSISDVFAADKYIIDPEHSTIGFAVTHMEVSGPAAIRGPVKTSYGAQLIGISGETIINRQDYGISWNARMPGGGLAVGNDVKIIVDVEAYKK